MAKERVERLRHGEDKLAVRQTKENLVDQILCEEDHSFATAGWAQIEAFTGKRPERVVTASRVGAADSGHALEISRHTCKTARRAAGCAQKGTYRRWRVLFIVLRTEVSKVTVEDGMELVATARDVPFRYRC